RFAVKYGFWRGIVEQSVAAFLKCGDLQEGFARVRCLDCKHEMTAPAPDGVIRTDGQRPVARLLCAPTIEKTAGADCRFERCTGETSRHAPRWFARIRLSPNIFPLRSVADFEDLLNRNLADPISGLLSALRSVGTAGGCPTLQITTRPAAHRHIARSQRAILRLQRGFPFFGLSEGYAVLSTSHRPFVRLTGHCISALFPRGRSVAGLEQALGRLDAHVFEAVIDISLTTDSKGEAVRHLAQLSGSLGRFTSRRSRFRVPALRGRPRKPGHGFLCTAAEIATIWHPPVQTVRVEKLPPSPFREFEPPLNLPLADADPTVAVLGRLQFRERRDAFGLRLDDRRRHLAVIGKTGMGKSTLLQRLVTSDIAAGRGTMLIDPHGDLVESVLAGVPRDRTNDIVLFDAGDRTHPVAFNPLDAGPGADRTLVASAVLGAFRKIYGDSWGPRMEHIWRNALLAAIDVPQATLVTVQRLLSDNTFRRRLLDRVRDPVVRGFWMEEFDRWKPNFQAEAIAPIQNKLGQFLAHPVLRSILDQPKSTVRLREIMDDGRVLLVNLSKGRIGDDGSALLGALLVAGLQTAALSRADTPEDQRRDVFAYVDEFQNFATESFGTILSEARKYRLSLTVANQYLGQLDETTRTAVFGNIGSLLTFQVGADDAEFLTTQLGSDVREQDLLTLPRYTAYVRLLIDGLPGRPFSMQTIPPDVPRGSQAPDVIRRMSRHRYGRPADQRQRDVAVGSIAA
ncbi:MAG: DUF87 domain-containing protein, partial [Planctomycetota bacterium]|nr:DUF87 domain-containing protein [Planctomycetota bacterium]